MKKTSKLNPRYNIFNWTLPAIKTCNNAGKCKEFCYAKQGTFNFGNVKKAHNDNYLLSLKPDFIFHMSVELDIKKLSAKRKGKQLVIRLHDSGDFYSEKYTNMWISLMKKHKDVLFYAYTKEVKQFKALDIPDNFRVIYSFGGKQDHLIDVNNDRHAKVFNSEAELKAANYVNGSDNDIISVKNKFTGLIIHGNKKVIV